MQDIQSQKKQRISNYKCALHLSKMQAVEVSRQQQLCFQEFLQNKSQIYNFYI